MCKPETEQNFLSELARQLAVDADLEIPLADDSGQPAVDKAVAIEELGPVLCLQHRVSEAIKGYITLLRPECAWFRGNVGSELATLLSGLIQAGCIHYCRCGGPEKAVPESP